MSNKQQRVLVVGGGVIGASAAFFLAEAGAEVKLIDQGPFGRGCSHGNCGLICPSHVLPLAGPGALWSTLRTLLARNSPLKVRCRFDPALWRWFWQFARRCNNGDQLEAGKSIQTLLMSSRQLYDQLLQQQTLRDVDWEARGLLFVFRSHWGMEHYADLDRLLRENFQLAATRYDGQQLSALEPSLKPGIAGAWHYETDAHLRPDKLMRAWRNVLELRGVAVQENCTLQDIQREGRIARRAATSEGIIECDRILIATGAWTPQLNRLLGCRIPVQPGKGYSITMPRPQNCPRYPMIFEEHRVAITPMLSGYRIGSTMEFAGYDCSLKESRLRLLRQGAAHYLQEPVAEPVGESWYGWRPMTPDGLPYIGVVPALENVAVATGHGMLGLSMAPATGRLVSEILLGRTPHLDPHPYRVNRPL